MPTLPPWATGGRIIFDAEYDLAFIRTERRGEWTAYSTWKGEFRYLGKESRVLQRARESVLRHVAESIEEMVHACHPNAKTLHLAVTGGRWRLLCNGPGYLNWTSNHTDNITCPMCLAVLAEDVVAQAKKVGHESVTAARKIVVGIRETNALGKLVTGEPMTEHEL